MLTRAVYKMKPPVSARIVHGHPLADKLIACYLFNERSGLNVFDSSGFGHNGVLTGAATWTTGKSGRAIGFDGSDGEVGISAAPDIDVYGKTGLSVSARVYPYSDGGGTYGRIIDKVDATAGYRLYVQSETDGAVSIVFFIYMSGVDVLCRSFAVLPIDQWSHILFTYNDGGTKYGKIYLNGVLQSLDVDTPGIGTPSDDSNVDLYIGNIEDGSRGFDGVLDNVMIWGRALPPSDIAKLYVDPFCMFARRSRLLVTI